MLLVTNNAKVRDRFGDDVELVFVEGAHTSAGRKRQTQ